ncbi:5-methyltetrahydropteroyltriglutamate--homocysteine S-methyltransferase [Chitinophaga parva]|uniref:5-methyltetrahydropteroyltriglutamate--homocysteine methyltransferase n=2 Tax=Chitinophaga parva TaxID=2169414 RepID=A0A2T7BQD8_9BACT|nr:5-methyltetrahydropteroyltriglutamate--homocysteine S-methyltransferase [Chitinophaga parva]
MLKNNLGYPRVGPRRELKKACEGYWAGTLSRQALFLAATQVREANLQLQKDAGIDLVPCNDFSLYDQVLDMSLLLGAIPERYTPVVTDVANNAEVDLYFAMARGYQRDGLDITAMEMTKWFDTNYHYIVPEFKKDQAFRIFSSKVFAETGAARHFLGKVPKPVLIGPVTYLLLGKEKEAGFDRIQLIQKLVPVYVDILNKLQEDYQVEWVQLDEPFLAMDLTPAQQEAFRYAYAAIQKQCPHIKILLTTYFDALGDNATLAAGLPVAGLHVDLVRAPQQLELLLELLPPHVVLSLGVIDGRNIWKNDFERSLHLLDLAIKERGRNNLMIAPSCSLLHTPFDLEAETKLAGEVRNWMAFAKQKLQELNDLQAILEGNTSLLAANRQAMETRRTSALIHNPQVKARVAALTEKDATRHQPFAQRQITQHARFQLPLFPTTTIGSFPQTADIRQLRARWKKGALTQAQYEDALEKATVDLIRWQEVCGLDVLVHGEFERNDMVEYFGEQLQGFLFTSNGWVQSYGSRCVKPPVIFGDVWRPADMTVRWSRFAQAHTEKWMKGMLTGPVTILQWSFVRDDQPRSVTANQLALAIRDEVAALENAGIAMIQIDEPAIREGLPLRRKDRAMYLDWAVTAFRISASCVRDETQIHTHMCYSEFNDIIAHIAAMDADVITIETSRSQMELLEAFAYFHYPNEIGPGVYDIHSPRVPSVAEMEVLLEKAAALLPAKNIWVNPDCGLKTRNWPETKAALENMVAAAKAAREKVSTGINV